MEFIMGDVVANAPNPGLENSPLSGQQVLLLVLVFGVMLLYGIYKSRQRTDY